MLKHTLMESGKVFPMYGMLKDTLMESGKVSPMVQNVERHYNGKW
jgi:hypothetical protein